MSQAVFIPRPPCANVTQEENTRKQHPRRAGNKPRGQLPACPATCPPPDAAMPAAAEAGGAEGRGVCCPCTHLGAGGGRLQVFTGADGSSRSHAASGSARKHREGGVRPAARAAAQRPDARGALPASPKHTHMASARGVIKGPEKSHHLIASSLHPMGPLLASKGKWHLQ